MAEASLLPSCGCPHGMLHPTRCLLEATGTAGSPPGPCGYTRGDLHGLMTGIKEGKLTYADFFFKKGNDTDNFATFHKVPEDPHTRCRDCGKKISEHRTGEKVENVPPPVAPPVPLPESATEEDLQGWIKQWETVALHRFDEDVETTTGRGEAFMELAKTFEEHQPAEFEQKTVSYIYEGGAGVGKTRLMLAYPPKEKDGKKGNNTERDTMLYLGFNCKMPLTEDEGTVTVFYAEALLARRLLAMLYVPRKT